MFDASLPSGSYVSKDGIEQPAAECNDLALRAAWAEWFQEHGVWGN